MKSIVPVSAILPTRNRATLLERCLQSLGGQTVRLAEVVICDASDDDSTASVSACARESWQDDRVSWQYQRADKRGLAPQRNQAVAAATQPFVWFLDDDVILDAGCLENMHATLASQPRVGGVTASITNQSYTPPGRLASCLMRWFEQGFTRDTYASACVGPGYTFMPDATATGTATLPAEWLIGCCSMYRKSVLPVPAVPAHFEDGALGEDLAASIVVRQTHALLHVCAARCFHDSHGGDHKRSARRLADQGLRNRYYIMTRLMGKDTPRDHFDFGLMLAFMLLGNLKRPGQWPQVLRSLAGYAQALWKLTCRPEHA